MNNQDDGYEGQRMKILIDIPECMYDCAQKGYLCGSQIIVDAIRNGTPYEERPTGHWIDKYKSHIAYECSCCGFQHPIDIETDKFCRNCGADMRGDKE